MGEGQERDGRGTEKSDRGQIFCICIRFDFGDETAGCVGSNLVRKETGADQ